MAGRPDDITPSHLAGPAVRSVEPTARRGGGLRALGLVVGLLLALAGTAAVFFTEDPLYLRVALLATCWAFLVAAFLAGGRRADQVAAESREVELRHAYDLELEREVAARKAHEVELERRLRREAEEGMRRELAALRADLAGLAHLRGDLAALGELRNDLGRLRSELTEQLSGELLIERMVMRAQAVRVPADPAGGDGRGLDGALSADAPRSASWEQRTTVEHRPDREDAAAGRALAAPPPSVVLPVPGPPSGIPADRPEPLPRAARPPAPATSTRGPARVDDDPAEVPAPSRPVGSPRPGPRWEPVSAESAPLLPSSPALDLRPAAPSPGPDDPGPTEATRAAEPPAPSAEAPAPPAERPPATGERPTPAPRSRYRVGLDAAPPADAAAPHRHRRAADPDEHRLPTGETRAAHGPAPEPEAAAASARPGPTWEPAAAAPDVSWTPPAWTWPPAAEAAAPEPTSSEPSAWPAAPERVPASGATIAPAEAQGSGHARLEQILADSGVSPTPGRRRRRYRDEDDPQPPDDVLARVLGRP